MVRKKQTKSNKYFLLNGKRIFIIMIAWFAGVILHNLSYAFFLGVLKIDFEEPFFFLIANLLIPIYLIVSVVYSLTWMVKNKKYLKKIFYVKLAGSIIGGLIITYILVSIDFLNDMFWLPFFAFTLLMFGVISLFQKNKNG